MARKDEDKQLVYYIPANFRETNVTSSGTPWRNLIEGGVLAAICIAIDIFLPLPITPKIIVGTILAGAAFIFGMKGRNNSSLSEFLVDLIKFKLKPQTYIKKNPYEKVDNSENVTEDSNKTNAK